MYNIEHNTIIIFKSVILNRFTHYSISCLFVLYWTIISYYAHFNEYSKKKRKSMFVEIPKKPGLGVELNQDAVARLAVM